MALAPAAFVRDESFGKHCVYSFPDRPGLESGYRYLDKTPLEPETRPETQKGQP